MANLMQAHREWASRPDDQRFWSLADMTRFCDEVRSNSVQAVTEVKNLIVEPTENNDLRLRGNNRVASLGHYAFGQLSRMAQAPADYLRTLPAPLAAQCLNNGFRNADQDKNMSLLCRKVAAAKDADLHVRAALSEKYTRIWNNDVLARLQDVLPSGWQVPPARPASETATNTRVATEQDVLRSSKLGGAQGHQVQVGDTIAPAGLYASDKDMFAFLVNEDTPIEVDGKPLFRGFFIWNSEVGDASFGILTFLYNSVCGNHIVWDASKVEQLSIRHIGQANNKAWGSIHNSLNQYAEQSTTGIVNRIEQAKRNILGQTKEEAVLSLFSKRLSGLTKGEITSSLDTAERYTEDHGDSNPLSLWAVSQGMTRYSQTRPHTDERVRLDRTAGKILELAF